MEFKLNIVGNRPTAGDLVLAAEVPLSGVKFIEVFGQAMRRSIDHVGRHRHITLGALAMYEVTVPQYMAIESGLFETTDTVAVYVENNLLSNFIFYSASMSYGATGRPCYPYMQNEATLVSMIDELAFLDAWANTNYATSLRMVNGIMVDASTNYDNNTGDNIGCSNNGGIGCDGCTCDPERPTPPPPHWNPPAHRPPEHHHYHPEHHSAPPPQKNPHPPVDRPSMGPTQKPSKPGPHPPVKPDRPGHHHRPGGSVTPIKPAVPPGYDNDCCDNDDCYCDDILKPGTIILDPITGDSTEFNQ